MLKRRMLLLILLPPLLGGLAYFGHQRYILHQELAGLPQFIALPEGQRAPTHRAMEVSLGESTLELVEALTDSRGLSCRDTSRRGLRLREHQRRESEAAEARARGEDPNQIKNDARSGASQQASGAQVLNPQARYTCYNTPSSALHDRNRPPSQGRWLFVFDSIHHPLRHVSYRRLHTELEQAIEDFKTSLEGLTALFGPPTEETGVIPTPAPASGATPSIDGLPAFRTVRREWRFADLTARVTLLRMGKRSIDLNEVVEVPWPVRADAPILP